MSLNDQNLNEGKIPPQALDLESVVLGSILMEPDAIIVVLDILNPESFYKEIHQKIYSAAFELFKQHKPIDLLTVTEQLRKVNQLDEVGGPAYVTSLTTQIGSTANLEYHARIVQEKYIFRELIKIGAEIQNRAFDDSIEMLDLIEYSQSSIFDLTQNNIKRSRTIYDIGRDRIEELETQSKKSEKITGISSGYHKIDNITSGWQPSDLIIIAARPSMGKTTMVFQFALNAAEKNKVVDLYSLEMSDKQLFDKAISFRTRIENSYLRTGQLNAQEWELIINIHDSMKSKKLLIDDTPALSIYDFRARARKNKIKYGTDLIIVDYLQLMKSTEALKRGGREREISDISAQLKATAKELDVPVIALSQLNRGVEVRSEKRPQLSDLRESGSIEQDADVVAFIHRPEYYKQLNDAAGNSLVNVIEFLIAKHRNGPIGDLKFWKDNNWTEIRETEQERIETHTKDIPF